VGVSIKKNEARAFIEKLHGQLARDAHRICFMNKRHGTGRVNETYAAPGSIPAEIEGLTDRDHVWVSVCPFQGHRNANNASAVPAVWVDLDPPSYVAPWNWDDWQEDAYRLLKTFILPPSMVVFSGRGWQVYWLLPQPLVLADGERNKLEQLVVGLNRRLVHELRGDRAAVDLARVMRLPGSVNPKTGVAARIVNADGPRYPMDELAGILRLESVVQLRPEAKTIARLNRKDLLPKNAGRRGRPSYGVTLRDLRGLPSRARDLVVGGGWRAASRFRKSGGGVDRSRADMAVVSAMVRAGWTVEKIVAAFNRPDWLIGARFRELVAREGLKRGSDYLQRTIGKARMWHAGAFSAPEADPPRAATTT
jgi:hypothetical protein